MVQISEHISYDEATNSPTAEAKGISNEPTLEHLKAMRLVAVNCFEPARKYFNVPLHINSFYRGKELNEAVKGSATSQHCKGEAIDIDGKGKVKNSALFNFIKANVTFSQLIAEFPVNGEPSWVHVSYSASGNKGEILIAIKENGKTKYLPYKDYKNLINEGY
jgi:hypothetical protein